MENFAFTPNLFAQIVVVGFACLVPAIIWLLWWWTHQ
tara:strand:- start:235 stop:345 length:111 start_codon:yes stop_codon:yes gene_type:complete